jgi:hypothetical protein
VTDTSRASGLSRRSLLAAMATAPSLTAAIAPAAAQTATAETAAQRAPAALKDAKSTKLVLLGTGAGPVPGRTRQMTSHVMLSNGTAYVLECGLGVTDHLPAPAFRLARCDRSSSPIITPSVLGFAAKFLETEAAAGALKDVDAAKSVCVFQARQHDRPTELVRNRSHDHRLLEIPRDRINSSRPE